MTKVYKTTIHPAMSTIEAPEDGWEAVEFIMKDAVSVLVVWELVEDDSELTVSRRECERLRRASQQRGEALRNHLWRQKGDRLRGKLDMAYNLLAEGESLKVGQLKDECEKLRGSVVALNQVLDEQRDAHKEQMQKVLEDANRRECECIDKWRLEANRVKGLNTAVEAARTWIQCESNTVTELDALDALVEALHECEDPKPQDKCEECHGAKGGVRGNENVINGRVLCDYCDAAKSKATPPPADGAPDRVWCFPGQCSDGPTWVQDDGWSHVRFCNDTQVQYLSRACHERLVSEAVLAQAEADVEYSAREVRRALEGAAAKGVEWLMDEYTQGEPAYEQKTYDSLRAAILEDK